MESLDRRIWAWLPARRDRRRTTVVPVIAANLAVSPRDVAEALCRMERGGHVVSDPRGSWHRGVPIKEDED